MVCCDPDCVGLVGLAGLESWPGHPQLSSSVTPHCLPHSLAGVHGGVGEAGGGCGGERVATPSTAGHQAELGTISTVAPSPLQLLTDTESRPSLYSGLVAVVSTPHTVGSQACWWSDMTE